MAKMQNISANVLILRFYNKWFKLHILSKSAKKKNMPNVYDKKVKRSNYQAFNGIFEIFFFIPQKNLFFLFSDRFYIFGHLFVVWFHVVLEFFYLS